MMLSRFAPARRALARSASAALVCGSSWLSACATAPLGATEANLARANQQAPTGASLFAEHCARCHGDRGQGRSGPQLMGAGALPKFPRDKSDMNQQFTDPQEIEQQVQTRAPGTPSREPFRHAGDVYAFMSSQMPMNKPGSLEPEQYWAILTFILTAHGVAVPDGGINPQNAASIPLAPP